MVCHLQHWGDRSPEFDGFPVEFNKACWGFIRVDFMNVIKDLATLGSWPK